MKIDKQKLLPGFNKEFTSIVSVGDGKVVALSDNKKRINFNQFVAEVTGKQETKKPEKEQSEDDKLRLINKELISIKKILIKKTKADKKYLENQKKLFENRRRKKREKTLEQPNKNDKKTSGIKNIMPSVGIFDAIQKFIGNILLGKLVLFLLDNTEKIINFLKYIEPVTKFLSDLTGKIFNGIVGLIEGAYDINKSIKQRIKELGGEGAEKEYENFTNALKKYLNLAIALTMAGIPGELPRQKPKPGKKPKPGTKPKPGKKPKSGTKPKSGKKPKPGSKFRNPLRRFLPKKPKTSIPKKPIRSSSYTTKSRATKLIEKKYGNSAAKIYENAIKNGKTPAQAKAAVNKAIKSGKIIPKAAAPAAPAGPGLGRGAGAAKGGVFRRGLGKSLSRAQTKIMGRGSRLGLNRIGSSAAAKVAKSRIPLIGPIMVAIDTYFEDVDPMDGNPDRKLDKALFKAGGSAIGAALGTFIPIPILGSILGTFVGEYVGDLFYILLKGGGPDALGQRLKKDIYKALGAAKILKDWILQAIKNIGWGGLGKLLNPFHSIEGKYFILKDAFFPPTKDQQKKTKQDKLDDARKAMNQRPERPQNSGGGPGGGPGGESKLGSGNLSLSNLTEKQFDDLAYAVSGEAQRGTDDEYGVAANILTRVADPNYPNTIMGVFTAGSASRPQYAAYWDGSARRDTQLAKKLKANKDKIAEAIQLLNGRTEFKGTSEYGNMGEGDIKFSSRGNFYHYASQKGKNDPPPKNPPEHWKTLVTEKPSVTQNNNSSSLNNSYLNNISKNLPAITLSAQRYKASRKGGRLHAGRDYDLGDDDTFYSRIGGEVMRVLYDPNGYGHYVDIYNSQLNVTERVAEGDRTLVKVGQMISPGTPVQQGTHQTGVIHYEIRKGKAETYGFSGTQNPDEFLESPKYKQYIKNLRKKDEKRKKEEEKRKKEDLNEKLQKFIKTENRSGKGITIPELGMRMIKGSDFLGITETKLFDINSGKLISSGDTLDVMEQVKYKLYERGYPKKASVVEKVIKSEKSRRGIKPQTPIVDGAGSIREPDGTITLQPKPPQKTSQLPNLNDVKSAAARIEEISGNKGTGERIRIPNVGTFVSGRDFLGRGEDKYFDPSGKNRIGIDEFEKRFKELTVELNNTPTPPPLPPPTLSPTPPKPLKTSFNSNLNINSLRNKASYENQGQTTLLAIQPVYIGESSNDPFGHTRSFT